MENKYRFRDSSLSFDERVKDLLAVGRKPENSFENVTCIGDACGKIQLAHFAIKQAVAEVDGVEFDENLVPSVVYGCPEIAWVGKGQICTDRKSTRLNSSHP